MSVLTTAASDNLVAHFTWVQGRTPGMRVAARDDLVLTDCGLPCDTFNAALRARLTSGAAPARVREAVEWFAAAGHPFSWWVCPGDEPGELGALLEAAGLARAEGEVAMAADLHALAESPPPPGLEIRRARTAEEVAMFARVSAANWSPPDEHVVRHYAAAAPALLDPASPLRLYVGLVDGEPVATSQLTVGGGVVGLYNIATLASHRRRGYGAALTLRPLLDARAEGHRVAILQAAPDGVGIYRRTGFEPFGEVVEYKPA